MQGQWPFAAAVGRSLPYRPTTSSRESRATAASNWPRFSRFPTSTRKSNGTASMQQHGRKRHSPRQARPCPGFHRAVFDRGCAILMLEAGVIGVVQGSWGNGSSRLFAFCSRSDAVSVASKKWISAVRCGLLGPRPAGLWCFAWILGDG